jgi:hypothetical protein
MADSRDLSSVGAHSRNEAKRKRAMALRAHAPTWLRALAAFAFVRAAAIVAIAWFWLDHRDEALSQASVIAWAICSVSFELLAGITLLVAGAGRMPWGVSVALTILGFGTLAIGVVLFLSAGVFAQAPDWALFLGLFDNLVRVVLMTGMFWPAILARAEAIDARYYASRG